MSNSTILWSIASASGLSPISLFNSTSTIIIIIIAVIAVFLIFREIVCWYGKINIRLREAQKTNDLLEKIYTLLKENNVGGLISSPETEKTEDTLLPISSAKDTDQFHW